MHDCTCKCGQSVFTEPNTVNEYDVVMLIPLTEDVVRHINFLYKNGVTHLERRVTLSNDVSL